LHRDDFQASVRRLGVGIQCNLACDVDTVGRLDYVDEQRSTGKAFGLDPFAGHGAGYDTGVLTHMAPHHESCASASFHDRTGQSPDDRSVSASCVSPAAQAPGPGQAIGSDSSVKANAQVFIGTDL
jgi:hypothetical protein